MHLYLLTKVDYIIHTAGAAECRVIGYMIDGQATWATIPLGYSSVYLLIYLFFHPERPSQTQDLPKVHNIEEGKKKAENWPAWKLG